MWTWQVVMVMERIKDRKRTRGIIDYERKWGFKDSIGLLNAKQHTIFYSQFHCSGDWINTKNLQYFVILVDWYLCYYSWLRTIWVQVVVWEFVSRETVIIVGCSGKTQVTIRMVLWATTIFEDGDDQFSEWWDQGVDICLAIHERKGLTNFPTLRTWWFSLGRVVLGIIFRWEVGYYEMQLWNEEVGSYEGSYWQK